MKFIVTCIVILFASLNLPAQNFWQESLSPTTMNLNNVFFINNNSGWIAGDSGFIARTNNAGLSWTVQSTGISEQIQDFYFINERLGWAIAWEIYPDSNQFLGTIILKTTNGGDNWTSEFYSEPNVFMKTVFFIDSVKGFLGGAPLTIVYTTNGGERWYHSDTDTSLSVGFPVENLKFVDPLNGYACGGFRDIAGSMWRTTNGGLNWRGTIVGPEPLNDIYIFSPLKAIAAGGDFEYGSSTVRTNNGGLNWLYDTLGTFGVASAIDFRTPYNGWIALGIAQKFAYSNDSGKSWATIYTPDSIPVFDLNFTDSIHGWAVGYDGIVLKYNPNKSDISATPFNNYNIPDKITLYQNYPNPFNPETIINFDLKKSGNVSLKIFDASGKEISALLNSFHTSGKYSVKFSGIYLPSGIYFYEVSSDGYSQTRKMILLK